MQFVMAVITLATTQSTNAAALAAAQKQAQDAVDALNAEHTADALTADEQANVDKALSLVSASTPATPAVVDATQTAVDSVPAKP